MKVRIESDQHGQGKVFIDGQEAKEVRSVWLTLGVDELTTVEVTYVSRGIEFEGEANVVAVIDGKKYRLIEDEARPVTL